MSESLDWIKPGALCNCSGEGSDTLIIRTVEDDRVSVARFNSSAEKSLSAAKKLWQDGFFCWESLAKIHRNFLPPDQLRFNLCDKYGAKLDAPINIRWKPKPMPCPDDIQLMLFEYFNIQEEEYLDAGFGYHLGAYLAEKMLKAERPLALAIGCLINQIYLNGLEDALSGYETSTGERISMLIQSIGIGSKQSDYFAKVIGEWSDALYYQSIRKALR
jgi:hypothetical protein